MLSELVPPLIARPMARRFLSVRYTGHYTSWAEAKRASQGYDAPDILAQVLRSARAVRDGHAAVERDGVAFPTHSYRWPLLACLLAEAARHHGSLRVVDFGGSIGSVYFQHRRLFRDLTDVRWAVVEQPSFVESGRREFENQELSFHESLNEATARVSPNVILFAGVLGWVEKPHAILEQAIGAGVSAIIVDRTPMTDGANDVAKVQHVPASIYRATYPCWFLSRAGILAHFKGRYEIRAELPQVDDANVPGATFGGFYLSKVGATSI